MLPGMVDVWDWISLFGLVLLRLEAYIFASGFSPIFY